MSKKKTAKIAVIVGILIFAFLVYIPISEAHRERQYVQALEYYHDSFYQEAYDLFYPLQNWKPEANAYAHICRARVLLDTGYAFEASTEMKDVSVDGLPEDLVRSVKTMNRAIDIALSNKARTETTTPRPMMPISTPKPVWTPMPNTGYKSYDEDEYDASDYSNPDDFYDDHYDDFFDYDEAEEYWIEHEYDD